MNKRFKVLLNGPDIYANNVAYGGGLGGYVRNVKQYIEAFQDINYNYVLCPHSVRTKVKYPLLYFPLRLVNDVYQIIRRITNYDCVHVLGQYRSAIYREFAVVAIAKLLNKKIIYDIKAGIFIQWHTESCMHVRYMTSFILDSSDVILCEGKKYIEYLSDYKNKTIYFPNFVSLDRTTLPVREKLKDNLIKVIFVGYCYEGKGVFELVEAFNQLANHGHHLELNLVGEESDNFKAFMDGFNVATNLKIYRHGRTEHEVVLKIYKEQDVFILPTSHSGEGHNNSINEAMMNSLVIITTRHGFLEDVLNDECAYFLDRPIYESIQKTINEIHSNKDAARAKAIQAYRHLVESYTDEQAKEKISTIIRKFTYQQ